MFHRVFNIVIFYTLQLYSVIVFGYQADGLKTECLIKDTISVKNKTAFQSNKNLNFNDFRSGINSVYVITPSEISSKLFKDTLFLSKYRGLMSDYLHSIGIENVAISSGEQERLDSLVSLTQSAVFQLKLDFTDNYISQIIISFISCNKDEFRFEKSTSYYIDSNWDKVLLEDMKSMYCQVVPFNAAKSYKLNSTATGWKEKNIIDYLENNKTDKIEGIYEKYAADNQFKIGVIKNKGSYEIIYLAGARNKIDWKEGDLKGVIRKTSIKDFYKVDWYMTDKSKVSEVYVSAAEENFLKFDFIDPKVKSASRYIKMFPSFMQGKSVTPSTFASSGTGFAISKEGIIVTCYHVIENGNSIIVRFKDKNQTRSFKADLLKADKENDLALLAIKDSSFTEFNNIPYSVAGDESDVGADVYTLGYPLIETMGKSIKLSSGIVSALSGFLDDGKYYQLAMPINSGNSGGPLFDKTGRLIGVITGKHSGAENVTYALKAALLGNLVKELPVQGNISNKAFETGKPLNEMVKSVQKYICVIEVK
jgi:S1-C subfamily serine protease